MARGKDDENTPQSDRDRRVLEQDQAPLSTELREAGLDHPARGEREAGGAAWEAAAEKAAHDKTARERTGRDVAGQDQRGRPDVERDQQQPAKEQQREIQQQQAQLDRQQQAAEAQRIRQDAANETRQAEQQRAYEAAQARGRDARGREGDALAERDQRYANTGHYRESAQDDAAQAHDLNRGADGLDDPDAIADEKRAQALMADHDRKRSVAMGDEDRGRAEDNRASRAAAEARGDENAPRPEPAAKAERGPSPSDDRQPSASQIKPPRRRPRARKGGRSAATGRARERGGREPRA